MPPGTGTGGHVGPTTYDIEKLFDDKVALADKYQFGGGDGGERWRVKIRGYWISKFAALQGILNWAEGMDDKRITMDIVSAKARDHFWMTEASVPRLSELLWGFLNTRLTGEAHTCFEGADVLNSLDAWRLVVNDIQKGKLMRTAQLRKLIRNPPQIVKLEDVDRGIARFENIHREYADVVGDRAPHDDERRTDLLECLPAEIREQLLWRSTVKGEDFYDFQNHVRAATNSVLYHRGKMASPINAVDATLDASQAEHQVTEKLKDAEETICAVLRKMGFQGQRRDGGGPRTDGPRGSTRPPRCANCQAEGHLARDCPKPKVEVSKRLCYECGKPGHMAKDCRSRGGRSSPAPVRMLDEEENYFGCVECDGWQVAARRPRTGTAPRSTTSSTPTSTGTLPRSPTHPTPTSTTLGDFIPTKTSNKFEALTEIDGKSLSQKQRKKQALLIKDIVNAESTARRREDARPGKQDFQTMVMSDSNEPNDDYFNGNLDRVLAPCYYETEDEEDDPEILAATNEIDIEVAIDSGAVAHVAGPNHLPGNTPVEQPEDGKLRNFVAANGGKIKNFGEADVAMVQDSGQDICNTFQVADVSRPLHSVGVITDTKKEVLFTSAGAVVVPDRALSKFLGTIKAIAKYPRKGGLYVAKMRAKNPKPKPATASGFGRQGQRR